MLMQMNNNDDKESFLGKAAKLGKEFLSYIKHEVIPFVSKLLDKVPYRKIRMIYPVLLVFNLLLFVFIIYSIFFNKNSWTGDEDKYIEIRKGSSLTEIIDRLSKDRIIDNKYTFKLAARITGKDDEIRPRRYIISSGLTNTEILSLLTDRNLVQTTKFRVPEGITIKKLAGVVEKKLFLSSDKFIEATKKRKVMDKLGLGSDVENLEGFLFPDTYII